MNNSHDVDHDKTADKPEDKPEDDTTPVKSTTTEPGSINPEKINKKQSFDKCHHLKVFCKLLTKFINELKTLLKKQTSSNQSLQKHINTCIKYYKSANRIKYVQQYVDNFELHSGKILENNAFIFNPDYLKTKHTKELTIIPGLDLCKINSAIEVHYNDDTSGKYSKTLRHVFNYLNSMYINACKALKEADVKRKQATKQQRLLVEVFKNLNLEHELKSQIKDIEEEEGEFDMKKSMDQLKEIFGEDSTVIVLIRELVQEIESEDIDMEDPLEVLNALFGADGERFEIIMKRIEKKLRTKIASGEIDINKMKADMMKAQQKVKELAPDMPDFDDESTWKKHLNPEQEKEYIRIKHLIDLPSSELTEGQLNMVNAFQQSVMKSSLLKAQTQASHGTSDVTDEQDSLATRDISTKPSVSSRKKRRNGKRRNKKR